MYSQTGNNPNLYEQRSLNTSQLQLNAYCVEHSNEVITNFCCVLDCLAPLCPDCIDQHNKFHKTTQTFPEIDSIKSVRINCVKKIKAAILALNQEMDRLEAKHFLSPMEMMNLGLENMRQVRHKAHLIVDNYFDNLEAQYKRSMQELHARGDDVTTIFDSIKKMINEMEYLQANLDGANTLITIKKVCLLDLKQLIEKAKRDIQGMVDQSAFTSLDVQINDGRIPMIESELAKFISINKIQQSKYQTSTVQAPANVHSEVLQFNEITNREKMYGYGGGGGSTNIGASNFNVNANQSVNYGIPKNLISQGDPLEGFYLGSAQKNQSNVNPHQQAQQIVQQASQNRSPSPINKNSQPPNQQHNVMNRPPPSQSMQTQQPFQNQNIYQQDKALQQNLSFQITHADYFEASCKTKFLHFFANQDKKLFLLDVDHLKKTGQGMNAAFDSKSIQSPSLSLFLEIRLNIDFLIPQFHKSLITPDGTIFLTGGSTQDDPRKKSNLSYTFNYKAQSLVPVSAMLSGRSSHAMAYLNGFVYAIGGFLTGPAVTSKCERLDLERNQWTQIANLHSTAAACSVCAFNGKYLFKFGGLFDGDNLNNSIERYDPQHDIWLIIDSNIDTSDPIQTQSQFRLLSTSASIQINRSEIICFGGYMEDSEGSRQTFLLTNDNPQDNNSQSFTIKHINEKLLNFAEGFWNNQVIMHDKVLFATQNIPNETDDDCLENNRRVISFNGYDWKSYN